MSTGGMVALAAALAVSSCCFATVQDSQNQRQARIECVKAGGVNVTTSWGAGWTCNPVTKEKP